MAKRLVKKGVTVVRDGHRVRPEIGKLFDFTKEEIDGLTEADPSVLGAAKEANDSDQDGEATPASTTPSAEASQAKARGGKKAATANKSDAEVADEGDAATDPTDDDL